MGEIPPYLCTCPAWWVAHNTIPISAHMSSLVVAPTDPAQLPGDCPESAGLQAWIPYHSHCYYIEASVVTSWALASLECTRFGERLLYQVTRFVEIYTKHTKM